MFAKFRHKAVNPIIEACETPCVGL